jgi:hypothetical protein
MNNDSRSQSASWWERFSDSIVKLRDGALALAGLSYLFGYGIWSFNAWQNGFGLLPAVQAQYLLAGAAPLIFTLITWNIVGWTYSHQDQLDEWLRSNFLALMLITLLLTLPSIGFIYSAFFRPNSSLLNFSYWGMVTGWTIVAGFCICLHGLSLTVSSWMVRVMRGSKSKLVAIVATIPNAINIFLLSLIPLIVLVGLTLLYYFVLYPTLPQEFGGMRPKFGYIDIERQRLSPQLRGALLSPSARKMPNDPNKDINPIVQTVLLDVWFETDDYLLVRTHVDSKSSSNNHQRPALRLPRDIVRSIVWHGYVPPKSPVR